MYIKYTNKMRNIDNNSLNLNNKCKNYVIIPYKNNFTVNHYKDLIRKINKHENPSIKLKLSGKKSEIIDRLNEYLKNNIN